MKLLICSSEKKSLEILNNFVKMPVAFSRPEALSDVDLSPYFCIISTDKIAFLSHIPVIDAKSILLDDSGIIIKEVFNSGSELNGSASSTFYTLLSEILELLGNLTDNDTFYGSPILNEALLRFETAIKCVFDIYDQPFVKLNYLPYGHEWGICLSHDVDNLSVKEHRLNRVILKSIAGSYLEVFYGNGSLKNALNFNFDCVKCTLFGFEDPYYNVEKWIELEKEIPSTFYFALEKGLGIDYSRKQVIRAINTLKRNNFEIGIHGQNPSNENSINKEFEEMRGILGKPPSGIRMHYLRFDENTWQYLEKAGYLYDTTYGYNQKVGYRSGTVMPYIVPLVSNEKIVEIPLHLMDTTLFNPRYMNLSTEDAIELTKNAISITKKHGGVLSVLVHQRSISKYFSRYLNWYLWLRETILKDHKCWKTNGEELANWHREWYDLKVDCHQTEGEIRVFLNKEMNKSLCLEVLVDLQRKIIEIPAGMKEVKVFID